MLNILLVCSTFFLVSFNCNQKILNHNEVLCLKMTNNFPIFEFKDSIGKIIKYDTFETRVYWYKNQVLYQRSYMFEDLSRTDLNPHWQMKYYSFVYTKGAETGLFFDSTRNIFSKPVRVDSMLKQLRKYKLEVQDLYSEMFIKYMSASKIDYRGDCEELYYFKGKRDSTMIGTVVFYFTDKDRFKNVEYSFSEELDNIKNKKLYKIVTTTNARFIGPPNNLYMDRSEVFQKIEKIAIDNPAEIKKYFEENNKSIQ